MNMQQPNQRDAILVVKSVKSDIAICLLFVAVMGSAIGCNLSQEKASGLFDKLKRESKQTKTDLPKMGPTKVVTDATALALELPESDLQATDKFRQRFSTLVADGRLAAANLLVARHPDHAYDTLSNHFDRADSNTALMATAYDQFCGTPGNWQSLISATNQEAVDAYLFSRKQFLGTITSGQFESTDTIDLVSQAKGSGSEALLVDAWYQTGIAQLLRQENAVAADSFKVCAQTAADRHAMQSANALLMCSEASRRAGDFAGATQAWQQSVELACTQIRKRSITDPSYWDRASYLQPVGTPWPTSVRTTFAGIGSLPASVLRSDLLRQLSLTDASSRSLPAICWIEASLGSWREARGEPQKALVHLKKAETQAHASAKDWLRIAQAPLLVSVGQSGTATTLLAPIIAREDNSPAMLAAMSKLGVMKLTSQSQQHGIRLLHRAVVDSPGIDWPGKASARADLALGLLMIGETSEGMQQLHQAQSHFEAEGEIEQLAKSLWNQQKYLEHSDAEQAAVAAIVSQLKTMQL